MNISSKPKHKHCEFICPSRDNRTLKRSGIESIIIVAMQKVAFEGGNDELLMLEDPRGGEYTGLLVISAVKKKEY
jgi:hypothetical protein